jgi:monoamine oxidase
VVRCNYVIMAMAPTMYSRIVFSPPMPAQRSMLCQRFPMGCVIKTVTFYERAWWRESGHSGSVLCDVCVPLCTSLSVFVVFRS